MSVSWLFNINVYDERARVKTISSIARRQVPGVVACTSRLFYTYVRAEHRARKSWPSVTSFYFLLLRIFRYPTNVVGKIVFRGKRQRRLLYERGVRDKWRSRRVRKRTPVLRRIIFVIRSNERAYTVRTRRKGGINRGNDGYLNRTYRGNESWRTGTCENYPFYFRRRVGNGSPARVWSENVNVVTRASVIVRSRFETIVAATIFKTKIVVYRRPCIYEPSADCVRPEVTSNHFPGRRFMAGRACGYNRKRLSDDRRCDCITGNRVRDGHLCSRRAISTRTN